MEIILWVGFLVLICLLLALDLGVFHKHQHVIKTREALLWTVFWVFLALLFNVFIYYAYQNHWFGIGTHVTPQLNGKEAALKYFTGYIIEKSLSLDNIFVIALIFTFFGIPQLYQHRILFWGILGALIMRGVMIFLGAALIQRFDWMIYVFGVLLVATAVKMLISKHDNVEPDKNPLIKFFKRFYPVTNSMESGHFFTFENGKRLMTPLFLVLLVIESSDLMFAIDSIPAIFAVTTDPFIVFTSNVFAILGLRSLYFALAALMDKFRYLKVSLVFLLAYVGVKMIMTHHYPIPTEVSLVIIIAILGVGVSASILANRKEKKNYSNVFEKIEDE